MRSRSSLDSSRLSYVSIHPTSNALFIPLTSPRSLPSSPPSQSDLLSKVNSLGDSGNLDLASGTGILSELTDALKSATGGANALPNDSVPASEPNETSALGTQVATIVTEVLRDVVAIVARLGVVLPVLAPLLLAVDGLVVGLLTALAPVVGGLLANVSALVFSLGGSNLAGLVANLGTGLTAGLLTLAVPGK